MSVQKNQQLKKKTKRKKDHKKQQQKNMWILSNGTTEMFLMGTHMFSWRNRKKNASEYPLILNYSFL